MRLLAADAEPAARGGARRSAFAAICWRGSTVSPWSLPPLRERVEEIPFLFAKIVEQERGAAPPPRLDPLLIERLCTHDWPFNVRELALLARRLLALHPDAAVLDYDALPAETDAGRDRSLTPATGLRAVDDAGPSDPDIDPDVFLAALKDNRGNVKRTATSLGISRGRAYRLLERYGAVDLDGIRQGERPASGKPPPSKG